MKKPSTKSLKNKAWDVFSKWVRLRGADRYGFNTCVTCGRRAHWKQLQAGHFIDGRHNAVLFNPAIVYPQCLNCNVFLHGNKVRYTIWMQENFGMAAVNDLLAESRSPVKLGRSDYEEIVRRYSTDE